MRILYFCNVNKASKAAVGVFKKINAQINILRDEGYIVDLAYYSGESLYSVIDRDGQELLRINLNGKKGNQRTKQILRILSDFIPNYKYSCIYSRYETYSLALSSFYQQMNKKSCIVLLEVPTYPITQRWTTIRTSLEQKEYKIALHQLYNTTINSLGIYSFKKGVSRIVNNNGYSVIWDIPTLKINNAVDVAAMPKHERKLEDNNVVSLIGVANVAKWHGYDRVILGLREYYKKNRFIEVIFHIVGDGMELGNLKRITNEADLMDKVIFHGTVVGKELDRLFNEADIGISILGAHRSHMKTCDSLKSKEYCARNLPFITGEIERQYLDKKFVLMIQDDDTPVSIESVVSFAEQMKLDSEISEQMENYARNNCDWSHAFGAVIEFLRNIDNEKN